MTLKWDKYAPVKKSYTFLVHHDEQYGYILVAHVVGGAQLGRYEFEVRAYSSSQLPRAVRHNGVRDTLDAARNEAEAYIVALWKRAEKEFSEVRKSGAGQEFSLPGGRPKSDRNGRRRELA